MTDTFGGLCTSCWCAVVEIKVREVNGAHRVLVVRAWGSEKPRVVYYQDTKNPTAAAIRVRELKALYGP